MAFIWASVSDKELTTVSVQLPEEDWLNAVRPTQLAPLNILKYSRGLALSPSEADSKYPLPCCIRYQSGKRQCLFIRNHTGIGLLVKMQR
jgi:hypothetical protein